MDEPIRLERQGHIALLTLNRPNTLNAMGERIAVNPPHALRWAKQLMMSGRKRSNKDVLPAQLSAG